jgi:hypothetical protein
MAKDKLDFTELKSRCADVVAQHAARNAMYTAIEHMYLMEWTMEPSKAYIKATMSPDPHNAITGIGRLLTSTDPVISVASSPKEPAEKDKADKLEKVLQALWHRANRGAQWPLHNDVCKSAALFSEVCIEIANIRETARWADVAGRDATDLKRQAKECPFSYHVRHPSCVYPQFGAFGLRSVLHQYRRPLWEVREFWGKKAKTLEGDDKDLVTYSNYWDHKWNVVWVGDGENTIQEIEHKLPFIPWVCVITDGSGMWTEPERQRNPMLYPVWKGQWWQRQNLLYSGFYTLAGQMAMPTYVITSQSGEKDVDIDLGEPGGKIHLAIGESVVALQKMLIDSSVTQGLAIANEKMTRATVPAVVFGESPGSTMSYSAMNLLSQGGRLPLVPIERQGGFALAKAFEITLRWIHHVGQKVELYNVGELASVEKGDINPDHIEVDVKLKADVPQDRLGLANMVQMLRQRGADGNPTISWETALQFLGMMQPADEMERVIMEQFKAKFVEELLKGGGQQQARQQPQQQTPMGVPPVQLGPPQMPGSGEAEMGGAPEMGGQGFGGGGEQGGY